MQSPQKSASDFASQQLFSSDEFRVYCFKVCLGAATVVLGFIQLHLCSWWAFLALSVVLITIFFDCSFLLQRLLDRAYRLPCLTYSMLLRCPFAGSSMQQGMSPQPGSFRQPGFFRRRHGGNAPGSLWCI
jgi:hypothetical protein